MKDTPQKSILRQDSRDEHIITHFGSPTSLPDEREFDIGLTNPIEPLGAVYCTALSGTDVCTDQTSIRYSYDDLWALTPQSDQGADPRESMGSIVKHGLQPVAGGMRDTRWKSYMRSDGNSGDYFLTTQNSMEITQSSTTVNSYWYREWSIVGPDGIMPPGVTKVSAHSYKAHGWKNINGVPHFHIKHWLGWMIWMPKDVYNVEMNKFGTGSYIPTTKEMQDRVTRNFIQKMLDAIVNIIPFIQRQIFSLKSNDKPIVNKDISIVKQPLPEVLPLPPVLDPDLGPVVHPVGFPQKIIDWANAIKIWEGNAPSLNNPGSLKVSALTQTWGAMNGVQASDGGYIAKFKDYQTGFNALCNFLKLGCLNQLSAFHSARTFKEFTKVYGGNPPQNYIDGIAHILGISEDVDISTFL